MGVSLFEKQDWYYETIIEMLTFFKCPVYLYLLQNNENNHYESSFLLARKNNFCFFSGSHIFKLWLSAFDMAIKQSLDRPRFMQNFRILFWICSTIPFLWN